MKWVHLLIPIITSACILGCAPPAINEEHEFSNLCQKLMEHTAEAEAYATKLSDFQWSLETTKVAFHNGASLADLNKLLETMSEELSPGASFLKWKCTIASNSVTKTLSLNPYAKPETVIEDIEITTIEQWRNMCLLLQYDLKDAVFSAREGERRANELFNETITSISQIVKFHSVLAPNFVNSRDMYKQICKHIKIHLTEALTVAKQLETWEFESLTMAER